MSTVMSAEARNANLVTAMIDQLEALMRARLALKGLRERITSLGATEVLTLGAFAGANSHVSAADVPPALAALDRLEAVLVDARSGAPTEDLRALVRFLRG